MCVYLRLNNANYLYDKIIFVLIKTTSALKNLSNIYVTVPIIVE